MNLVEPDEGVMVRVRWRRLPECNDTFQSVERIHGDVLQLLLKLLRHKNTPQQVVDKALCVLLLLGSRM